MRLWVQIRASLGTAKQGRQHPPRTSFARFRLGARSGSSTPNMCSSELVSVLGSLPNPQVAWVI